MSGGGAVLGAGRGSAWAWAVLAAGELAWIGWWLTTGSTALFAVGQLLVLALVALVVVLLRYLSFRSAFERGIAHRAVQVERNRLAEELHDQLGHELSLVALRAGVLQVTSSGSSGGTAQVAGDLRAQVEEAVVQLRQTVELLRTGPAVMAPLEPTAVDVAGLVARARAAGAEVTVSGSLGPGVPAPVRLTASRVVQEGLTNAARHAPGAALAVDLRQQADGLEISVRTLSAPLAPTSATRGGSGLAALHRRITAVGGALSVAQDDDGHVLRARLPFHPEPPGIPWAVGGPAARGAAREAGSRRPWRTTLRWALPPAVVVALSVVAFYTWATTGAVVEQRALDQLAVGEPVAQAHALLPERQAPVHLLPTAPAPPAWTCRLYTDGNVPLGMATIQVCDDGARLTRVDDLRRVSWS